MKTITDMEKIEKLKCAFYEIVEITSEKYNLSSDDLISICCKYIATHISVIEGKKNQNDEKKAIILLIDHYFKLMHSNKKG